MLVLKMFRDALGLFHLDLLHRIIQRIVSLAVFRRATHVGDSMRERNARLGHTDKFHRLLRRDGQRQCIRIGEADVFAGKNDDASRDETEILASQYIAPFSSDARMLLINALMVS